MFKTLLKKQLLEILSSVNRKNGKGKQNALLMAVLYVFLFGILGMSLYAMLSPLCEPLSAFGLDWMYFALIGMLALLFGVIGSVFMTYQSLYIAKDNEFLLSLPIKPALILGVRVIGVYLIGLLYILLITVPASIAYIVKCSPSEGKIALMLLLPIVLAFFALALTCLLGWVVAIVARRLKNKSLVTMLISIAFMVLYYGFYSRAFDFIEKVVENPFGVSSAIHSYFYPFYLFGRGAEGNIGSFLLFALISIAAAAIVCFIVALGFKKTLVLGNSVSVTDKKARFDAKKLNAGSVHSALFKKELSRFTASANYMLNANMGLLLMLAAAVGLLVKGRSITELFDMIGVSSSLMALFVCAAVCLLVSYNITSASSVSIEGNNIWIPQSFPIAPVDALNAKLKLHLVLVLPALLPLLTAVLIVFSFPLVTGLLICAFCFVFTLFAAVGGLALNLKFPNLHWTSEAVPVKQSTPVFICSFGGMVLLALLGILYYFIRDYLTPLPYIAICTVILAIATAVVYSWIRRRGAKIYAYLN